MTPHQEDETRKLAEQTFEACSADECEHTTGYCLQVCDSCRTEIIFRTLHSAIQAARREALELAARVAETACDGSVLMNPESSKALARHIAENIRSLAPAHEKKS